MDSGTKTKDSAKGFVRLQPKTGNGKIIRNKVNSLPPVGENGKGRMSFAGESS